MHKIFIPIALFSFGTLFLIIGIDGVLEARQSQSWLSTEGLITKSDVVVKVKRVGKLGKNSRKRKTRRASIEYQYQVDGIKYHSHRVTFGMVESADELVAEYPNHKRVIVYYDPSDPSSAVLIPGERTYTFIFIGAIFIGVGAIFQFVKPLEKLHNLIYLKSRN
jgi:hypothetical protein